MNRPVKSAGSTTPQATALRKRAEEIFLEKTARLPENLDALSPDEVRQMLHELEVHQVELEMQNEELRREHEKLDAALARYFDLYDLAPVGYVTLSEQGLILEANLATTTLLGVTRGDLIRQPFSRFILKEDCDIYYLHRKQLLEAHSPSSGQAGAQQPLDLRMVKKDGTIFWVYMDMTAAQDADGTPEYHIVMKDISARKQAEEELKETLEKLRKSLIGTIQALSSTVETRDPYTAGHQIKVSNLARAIAQEMGLPNGTVDTIRMAGVIHDIGKISVPAEILSKPGKLLDMEMNLIRVHSQSGYDILKDVGLPYPIAEMVLQHHERLDGSGYPQGLKDGQILLEARIISVADVVEAIASYRPYRPALGIDVALEEIEKNAGVLYDREAVEACVRLFREKEFTFE